MIALAVGLAVALAGTIALVAWLVYRVVGYADHFADVRVAQVATEAHLSQTQFELEAAQKALADTERRATALEGVLADEVNRQPNPDLARGDVLGRIVRFAQSTKPAAVAASGDGHAANLHPPGPAASPRAAELPAGSATVR